MLRSLPRHNIASLVAHGDDRRPADLHHRVDHLLYQAKAAGRHCVAFPGWVDRRQR